MTTSKPTATVTVTVRTVTEGLWGTPDELAAMTDTEIIKLIQEDIPAFIDGAIWEVSRQSPEKE